MIVTQHGDREKEFNILQPCAQKIIGYDDWQSYWPFLVCTETEFETLDMSVDDVGMDCAEGIPELDSNTLLGCLNDPEQAYPALYNMAINTFDHPGTPTILVNGGASPLYGFWDNATAADVCQAYTGSDVPPACPGLIEEKNKYLPGGYRFFKGLVDGSITCHEVQSKSSKNGKRNKSDKNNLFVGNENDKGIKDIITNR